MYTSNANFQSTGVTTGPFSVLGNVSWDSGQIATTFQGGQQIGALALDSTLAVAGSDCAMTVQLIAVEGGGEASFGFSFAQDTFAIDIDGEGANDDISFAGSASTTIDLPAYLALVRSGGKWYAAFRDSGHPNWTFIAPHPMGKEPPPGFPQSAGFGFGQVENSSSTSFWDDFNVEAFPLAAMPDSGP